MKNNEKNPITGPAHYKLLETGSSVRRDTLQALRSDRCEPFLRTEMLRELFVQLGNTSKKIQREVCDILVELGRTNPEVVDGLARRLKDKDTRVRWTAAFALSRIRLKRPLPLPVLIENLGHQESDLRWAAAAAILELAKHHHKDVVSHMIGLTAEGNSVQRRMSLYCLRDLDTRESAAIESYMICLNDTDEMVRMASLSCIGSLSLTTSSIRSKVATVMVSDAQIKVRRHAAIICGQIGQRDPKVLDALEGQTRSKDDSLARASTISLSRLRARHESRSVPRKTQRGGKSPNA